MRTLVAAIVFAAGTAISPPVLAGPNDLDVKVQIVDQEVRTSVSFFVPASQQRVWEVITDYERAPDYLREVQSAKVVARSGDTFRVSQKDQVKFGPFSIPIETVRDVKHIEPVRTESHIVSGSFKKYDAEMKLVPEAGGTRVIYRSQAIPDSALAAFAGESTIRKHAEDRFKQLRAEILRREHVATRQ
jgi:carbon monoxide dehydrogenase subunit G